jgi:PilZ domain
MSVVSNITKRSNERISLSISAVVKAKESNESSWKETTELISMSRSGAGFYIARQCEVGRLVSLLMPMPRHLRCYDTDKELYRVWGLVQHCSQVSGDGEVSFHVGVAFVGKKVPASYYDNPLQSYRIAGMSEDGTWKIVESKTDFVVRRHPRYWVSLEIMLSALDSEKNMITDEKAATENISLSGAAIYSDLDVNIGDSVNFDCIPHNFSALAIVRNRQTYEYELPKLHLEFINAIFPVEEVSLPSEKEVLADEEIAAPIEEFAEV